MSELKAYIPPEPSSSEKILDCLRRALDVAYQYEAADIKISMKLKDGSFHNDRAKDG